ncbi:DUF6668 family protein [Streptomyces flaveolus]|uniref:DUF6668 family protein n=1 Tax=Streptomyces flaveolus TaxID=67297 RepID=UPI0033E88095
MSTPAAASSGWVRGPVAAHPEQAPRPPDPAAPRSPDQPSPGADSWARPRPQQHSDAQPEVPLSSGARPLQETAVRPVPSHGPQQRFTGEQAGSGFPPAGHGHEQLVSWVNAHGGAGATTFAAALGGTDAGGRWPDARRGQPGRIFLLARTHAAGLRAASRAMNALHTGKHPPGIELLSLVLVADAPGRLPLELSRRVRVLRSATPIITIPWIPAWRLGEPATKAPREIAKLVTLIRSGSAAQGDRR